MKDVLLRLLNLRDELYNGDMITMGGVWKLNCLISEIQEENGVTEADIGYEGNAQNEKKDERACYFNTNVLCNDTTKCCDCGWNPVNRKLRRDRVERAKKAYSQNMEG